MPDARKALIFKAFRASFTLVPAGYIAPRDPAPGGDLSLGHGAVIVQPVAQGDDHPLSVIQAACHTAPHPGAGIPGIQFLQHVVIHPDGIHE